MRETTAEYSYEYAGQDPINNYDLSGTFLQGANDGADRNPTCIYTGCSLGGSGFPNYAGPASLGTIGGRLLGSKVTHAITAAVPYREACGTSAAIGAATGGGLAGAVLGCATAVASTAFERHGHKNVGTFFEYADAFASSGHALKKLAELGAKNGVYITEVEAVRIGPYIRIRASYFYTRSLGRNASLEVSEPVSKPRPRLTMGCVHRCVGGLRLGRAERRTSMGSRVPSPGSAMCRAHPTRNPAA